MEGRLTDLSDLTFVLPFCYDLPERLRNLRIVTEFICSHFDTHLIVSEYDAEPKLDLNSWPAPLRERITHRYHQRTLSCFQKARSVNLAAQDVETPYLAVYDCDVLLQSRQFETGIDLLRSGACDMSLPFGNRVMWIPPEAASLLRAPYNDQMLAALDYERSDDAHLFLGLVTFIRTDVFRRAGLMNEHFRSWGFEEMEFYIRLLKLGYRILRGDGCAYHLGHGNGGDTGPNHPYYEANKREYHKVFALNPDDLRRYIAGWGWTAQERPAEDVAAAVA